MNAILHRFTIDATTTRDYLFTAEAGVFRIYPTDIVGVLCAEPCGMCAFADEMAHVKAVKEEAPELVPLMYEEIDVVMPRIEPRTSIIDMEEWRMLE